MKLNRYFMIPLLLACLFASCDEQSGTKRVNIPDNFNSERIITNRNRLQRIVTREMVAEIMHVYVDSIMERIEKRMNSKGQYTVLYSWPTGGKKKVGDGKYEIGEYHSLSIGFVRQMDQESFEKYYGTNKGLQMQVDGLAKQENFNKEIGTAEAEYIADYAKRRKSERLENVATLAFWETPMHALHVLAEDVAFTITTNFGDDASLAKKSAVSLAAAILHP